MDQVQRIMLALQCLLIERQRYVDMIAAYDRAIEALAREMVLASVRSARMSRAALMRETGLSKRDIYETTERLRLAGEITEHGGKYAAATQ